MATFLMVIAISLTGCRGPHGAALPSPVSPAESPGGLLPSAVPSSSPLPTPSITVSVPSQASPRPTPRRSPVAAITLPPAKPNAVAVWNAASSPQINVINADLSRVGAAAAAGAPDSVFIQVCASLGSDINVFRARFLPTPDPQLTGELTQAMAAFSRAAVDCIKADYVAASADLGPGYQAMGAFYARLKTLLA